jgi:hypothetical protein
LTGKSRAKPTLETPAVQERWAQLLACTSSGHSPPMGGSGNGNPQAARGGRDRPPVRLASVRFSCVCLPNQPKRPSAREIPPRGVVRGRVCRQALRPALPQTRSRLTLGVSSQIRHEVARKDSTRTQHEIERRDSGKDSDRASRQASPRLRSQASSRVSRREARQVSPRVRS